MSLKRILAFALLAACSGAHETAVQKPQELPLPPPSAKPSSDAGQPAAIVATACLDPYEGGKPVNPQSTDPWARGREYFTAEQWVEAAKVFRTVAMGSPDSSQGIYAAQLYLESLNQLGKSRVSCFDEMARDVPPLHALYCGARRAKSGDTCELLERIDSEVTRLRAERLDQSGDHRGAAEQFLTLLRARCLPAKSKLACDEIAYNAAILFLAANDEPAAKNVRALMTDPKNKMDKSPLVPKIACRIDHTPCH